MDYHEKTNPVLDVFRHKEYVISVDARPAPEAGQQEIGQKLGVGAENLCHQAIFMNQASRAVASLYPEMVQVGDAVWQRTKRRGLAEGAVRPVRVVEVLVLAQDGHQVALVSDQGPVQQLAPAAPNPTFHNRIHSRHLDRGADHPDASGSEN